MSKWGDHELLLVRSRPMYLSLHRLLSSRIIQLSFPYTYVSGLHACALIHFFICWSSYSALLALHILFYALHSSCESSLTLTLSLPWYAIQWNAIHLINMPSLAPHLISPTHDLGSVFLSCKCGKVSYHRCGSFPRWSGADRWVLRLSNERQEELDVGVAAGGYCFYRARLRNSVFNA